MYKPRINKRVYKRPVLMMKKETHNWPSSSWTLTAMPRRLPSVLPRWRWRPPASFLTGTALQRVCPQRPVHHRVCAGHSHVLHADGLRWRPADGEWSPFLPSTLRMAGSCPSSPASLRPMYRGHCWLPARSPEGSKPRQRVGLGDPWRSLHAALWKTKLTHLVPLMYLF